jgi:general secretion pathway protein G
VNQAMDSKDSYGTDRFWVSLILLLLVVIVVSIASILYFEHRESAAVNAQLQVQADFRLIERGLQQFYEDMECWPTDSEGLNVLREPIGSGPYIVDDILDPWGRPYRYKLIEEHPYIQTLGKDGQPGGPHDNRDLGYTVLSTEESE